MTITDDDPVIGSIVGQEELDQQGTITPPDELDPLAAMMADAAEDDAGKAEASAEPLYSMPICREAENAVVDAVIQEQEKQQQQLAESIAAAATVDASNHYNNTNNKRKMDSSNNVLPGWQAPGHRIGRWTLDEKLLFLYGLQKFGKGRWKKISTYVPDRSLIQIKSHAQKVLKRFEKGENVFHRLEENCSRLHFLVSQIHESQGWEPPTNVLQANSPTTTMLVQTQQQQPKAAAAAAESPPAAAAAESPASIGTKRRRRTKKKGPDGTEHILAASALCQLADQEGSGSSANSVADGETSASNEATTAAAESTAPTAGDASAAKIAAAGTLEAV